MQDIKFIIVEYLGLLASIFFIDCKFSWWY
jgi:hypothetical protein